VFLFIIFIIIYKKKLTITSDINAAFASMKALFIRK